MFSDGAACIVLGFTSGTDSLQDEPVRPHAPTTLKNRQRIVYVESSSSASYPAEGTQPRATGLARILSTSPWFSIVIELLTGHAIIRYGHWIYPFKYLIIYLKHIKMFVQLLDDIELDSLKVGDMLPTLTQVAEKVATSLGPKRNDFTYSTDNTAKIVYKEEDVFRIHRAKAERSSPADEEMKDHDGRSDQLLPSRNKSGMAQSDDESLEVAEHESSHLTCTCLRDARDHLQIVCNVIEEHLSDLLLLHSAVSNHSLRKIKFQDLWLLYNPGDLIISSKAPHQAYRVIHVGGGRPLMTKSTLDYDTESERERYQDHDRKFRVSPFKIDCVKFDFNGENFGPVQTTIEISHFDEDRNIVELDVYPINFAEDKAVLRETLLTRGQRFAAFKDFKHQKYAGLSLGDPSEEVRRNRKPTSS